MAQIYVAAPFFDAAQTKRLDQVLAALQVNKSVTGVFSPRDDTNKAKLEENSPGWQRQVFGEDIQGLHQATIMVAILDYVGDTPDPGTAFEIGYAYAHHMPIVAVQVGKMPMNLMLAGSITCFVQEIAELKTLDLAHVLVRPYVGLVF
ncbi:nucleoside 2-deoxyribosyltransferase [Lacticaseibacillus paracasei]|uniref:nucleoside 2-deoxyribosyltransferase n=1 Tax=Lacticaseibacillus paracasei TaxID=1597 RepID=UPI00237EFDC8|nr:nucleoside 2-deoxyribosyltransferase [Lacticaseibacillus paracasei]MDE3305249.1 nucleoside 2-deoxyribosyltransferase [Lacticaseibacillus paracasei]